MPVKNQDYGMPRCATAVKGGLKNPAVNAFRHYQGCRLRLEFSCDKAVIPGPPFARQCGPFKLGVLAHGLDALTCANWVNRGRPLRPYSGSQPFWKKITCNTLRASRLIYWRRDSTPDGVIIGPPGQIRLVSVLQCRPRSRYLLDHATTVGPAGTMAAIICRSGA